MFLIVLIEVVRSELKFSTRWAKFLDISRRSVTLEMSIPEATDWTETQR